MTALIVIVTVATLFGMMAWAVGTAYRLYFPETPSSTDVEPTTDAALHILPRRIPVGARDIREEQRRVLTVRNHVRYAYTDGFSHGVPDLWLEDLRLRRN